MYRVLFSGVSFKQGFTVCDLFICSFTTGYIYSASHHLPPGEEFQTYDQVRLHWKKQVSRYYTCTQSELMLIGTWNLSLGGGGKGSGSVRGQGACTSRNFSGAKIAV